jgi:hypothetical protein
LSVSGRPDATDTAIRMFEEWLDLNPDHAMARRRLTNLKAGG